jgi:hypothetical protein
MSDTQKLAVLERVRAGTLSPAAAASELEALENAWIRVWADLPWSDRGSAGDRSRRSQDRCRA